MIEVNLGDFSLVRALRAMLDTASHQEWAVPYMLRAEGAWTQASAEFYWNALGTFRTSEDLISVSTAIRCGANAAQTARTSPCSRMRSATS